MIHGLQSGMGAISLLGNNSGVTDGMATKAPIAALVGEKPKKTKQPAPYDMAGEMKKYGKTPMKYDDGDTPDNISKVVGQRMGIKPSLLFSSAWQEGMNKATLDPEKVSDYYVEAGVTQDFPIDGFANYGTDTIGDKWDKVKKYLPQGFESNMKFFDAVNENGQKVKSAAFNYNENALMAKAAMMKYEQDNINNYAQKNGIILDDKAKDYFMLAAYNGGAGNAQKMINEYKLAKDKAKFIDEGQTSLKGIHKNIKVRLDNMAVADEIFNQK